MTIYNEVRGNIDNDCGNKWAGIPTSTVSTLIQTVDIKIRFMIIYQVNSYAHFHSCVYLSVRHSHII